MILIFDVWRSVLQLFTVGNRQELVIYGGKPSGISYYGEKPSAAGQAGPATDDWLRATRALLAWLPEDIIYLYRKSQMLFVGKLELELALWATKYLTPHRYLQFPTFSMNFTVNHGYVT